MQKCNLTKIGDSDIFSKNTDENVLVLQSPSQKVGGKDNVYQKSAHQAGRMERSLW